MMMMMNPGDSDTENNPGNYINTKCYKLEKIVSILLT